MAFFFRCLRRAVDVEMHAVSSEGYRACRNYSLFTITYYLNRKAVPKHTPLCLRSQSTSPYSALTVTNSEGAPFVSTTNSRMPSAVADTASPTGSNGSESDVVA